MANAEWWQGLKVDDLKRLAPELMRFPIASAADVEKVASWLVFDGPMIYPGGGPFPDDERPPRSAWEGCKREFRILICSDDPRYSDLRTKLGALGAVTAPIYAQAIAEAFTDHIPSATDLVQLTGLVAVGIAALVSIGRLAFCG
jgi:hypothetical protein